MGQPEENKKKALKYARGKQYKELSILMLHMMWDSDIESIEKYLSTE